MAGIWDTHVAPTEPLPIATVFPPCAACGSIGAVPIAYGYPNVELFEAERRGEVILGGCLVGPESPEYECRACHAALPWTTQSMEHD